MLMLDQRFFIWIHSLAEKSRLLDFLGIFLAEYLGYFLIGATITLVFRYSDDWKKRWQYFSTMSLSVILSRGIFTEFIRFFYYRPRPFVALDFTPLIAEMNESAFPSGHMSFYLALVLPIFLIDKRWGWRLTAGVLLMGIARIFIGVHWPLDILWGILTALLSFYLVKTYLNNNF